MIKLLKAINKSIPDQVRHFGNYFGTFMATKAIGFLSIPIFTRLFSLGDYGILNLFSTYLGIFGILLTFNLHTAIGRYFYDKESDEDFNEFVGSTGAATIVVLFISSFFFILFSGFFASLLELPRLLLIFLPLVLILQVVSSVFMQIMQPLYQSKKIARLSIFTTYLTFFLSVLLVFFKHDKRYMATIYAQLIIGTISTAYYINAIRPYFKFTVRRKHVVYMLKYSVPMIPYALGGVILAQIDRVMINHYEGADSLGMYSFAYNIAMLMSMFVSAIYQTWIPRYFEYMNDKNYTQHDKEVDKINRIIILLAMGLIFFGREIGLVLAPHKFNTSLNIIPFVVSGYVFESIFMVYGRNIGYSRKTIYHTLVSFASGFFNIWLNAIFIPKYGYKVAALTTLASYAFMTLLAWMVNSLIIKLPAPSISKMIKPTLYLIPIIYFNYLINNYIPNIFISGIIKISLVLIFFMLIFKVRNYRQAVLLIKE